MKYDISAPGGGEMRIEKKEEACIIAVEQEEVFYPPYVARLCLEPFKGPTSFDVGGLEHWLHDDQQEGFVTGDRIFACLKETGLIQRCLGFRELYAIQAQGLQFFRRHFYGEVVFGWGGVFQHAKGSTQHVPCLTGGGESVEMGALYLPCRFGKTTPALLFPPGR